MTTPRILLIEDKIDFASRLRVLLSRAGCETIHASSAAEAVRVVQLIPPDLAIIDLDLPGDESLDAISLLRWNARGLKVIGICSQRRPAHRLLAAWSSGVQRIVTEPESDALISAVMDVLETDPSETP